MSNGRSHRLLQFFVSTAAFAVVALLVGPAFADQVPVSITQQGRLLDDGEPLTGSQSLEFELYNAETGGDILWSDVVTTDLDDHGVYTAVLGDSNNPIDATILQDGEVFLQLTVNDRVFSPRLELTSVPFAAIAQSAEVAQSVVDGGVTADALADGAVTADAIADGAVSSDTIDSLAWDKIYDIPDEVTETSDTLAELNCSHDQIAVFDGTWSCANQQDTTYDGSDFALSDQNCSGNQVAAGINTDGTLHCIDQIDTTYDGSDFALSAQNCSGDQVAAGINTDGTLNCIDQQDTTYDGETFALSAQNCSGDQVAAGINTDGTLHCIDQQDTTYSAGTGLDLQSGQFAADTGYFDSNYLQSGGSIHVEGNVTADGYLRANADESSTLSYLRFRDGFSSPRLYHNDSSDSFIFRGVESAEVGTGADDIDLSVSGELEVGEGVEVGGDVNMDGELDIGGNYQYFGGDNSRIYYSTGTEELIFSDALYELDLVRFYPEVHVSDDFTVTGTKNFVQPHSQDPSKQVNYIAMEGGEPGVYWRGSATTENGTAVIELPEHFTEVVSSRDDLTTTVTPQGQWAPLYVKSESTQRLVVAVDDRFDIGEDVTFDFHVQGVRAGLEDRGGIVDNTLFTPQAYGITDDGHLIEQPQPHIRRRLINNGTLNPDGTVNEQTAQQMGWQLQPE